MGGGYVGSGMMEGEVERSWMVGGVERLCRLRGFGVGGGMMGVRWRGSG